MQKIKGEMTEQEALKRLEALCARSERCTFDVRRKMAQWGLGDEECERVVAELVKNRYVDDGRYARAFAADKIKYNKWGKNKVDQALRLKRIGEDARRAALEEFDDGELTAALRPMLEAKMHSVKARNDYELFCKLLRFALGRGFGMEDARRCLEDILGSVEE